MSGISSTLSISKTAISAQQKGLAVTGQNIANVNNPDYSVQNADQQNMRPSLYAGFLFGTGVEVSTIQQNVDKLLEQRLTNATSAQASFDEQESYIRILEGFFDPNSETSISSVLTEFWNSWHDLSDNPMGSSERVAVYESGEKLASRFETTMLDMQDLSQDINTDIIAAVDQVNALSRQIAELNQEILSAEIHRTANDFRDQRHRLVDELGEIISIDTFERPDGSIIVNVASAFTIVSGVDHYDLKMVEDEIVWDPDIGMKKVVTDDISAGRLGGLLEMRDEIIPKYMAEMDELAREMIWGINYQHSQGAGLEYFKDPVIGDYATDSSRWLTGYEFGDKIDFSKDFTLWIEDKTTSDTQYTRSSVDMGVSEARITNWQGMAPGSAQSIYRLTVVEEGMLGDSQVIESDGDGLAVIHGSTVDGAAALAGAIARQTIYVYDGPDGTGVVEVDNNGGDAKQSAASIAGALNDIAGVTAYASEVNLSVAATVPGLIDGIVSAEDGDTVVYSLYVDGLVQEQRFIRDSSLGTLQEQFEESLLAVAEAVNTINEDEDLSASGLTITSSSGRTLGIQDFAVQDNTGVLLDNFNFATNTTVEFTVDSIQGAFVQESETVTVDLTNVDTTDQSAVSEAFGNALTNQLDGTVFTVAHDPFTGSVILRTTDGTDIQLTDAGPNIGGAMAVTELGATTHPVGDNTLSFTGAGDTERFNAEINAGDSIDIYSPGDPATTVTVNDVNNAGPVTKAGIITGTVTLLIEPGMTVYSSVAGAGTGGLFSTNFVESGSSILTFGGEGGFSNFTLAPGEVISFNLDGHAIDFSTMAAGGTSDIELATELEAQLINDLTAAGVDHLYRVIRTGSSVSVIKDASLEDPIAITGFTDSLDNDAQIRISTGTGIGISQPENDLLQAGNSYRDFATSSLYSRDGVIMWERLDADGVRTGNSGLLTVEDKGRVEIIEGGAATVSFDISAGSLVAGNVLTVNTDESGRPDPLDFRITGQANSINDIYRFRVVSGGKVGHLPAAGEEPLVIEWSNSERTGTFTIEGHDPPYTPQAPVEVLVDGMNMKFYDGTLFTDDVFTVTTGDTGIPMMLTDTGNPTGERLSDWHWTIDSFAGQFNKDVAGMTAHATADNRLKFEVSDSYYTVQNIQYSQDNGFNEANAAIEVRDWRSLDFLAADLRFERSAGSWGVLNDPTGGMLQMLPPGGDDDGFGIDFSGDGLADIHINFVEKVTGDGFIEFDIRPRNALKIGFAFSDDIAADSGLTAAAGINNYFTGYDSMTMAINDKLKDTKFVAAAAINADSGLINNGDNANALAIADVQFESRTMKLWTYDRGRDPESSTTMGSIDEYYNQLISSMGIKSRTIKNSKEFADMMINDLTAQRDSVSAVSLDEEMIKLMKYQHAFSAASKLLTTADQMLNTLISIR